MATWRAERRGGCCQTRDDGLGTTVWSPLYYLCKTGQSSRVTKTASQLLGCDEGLVQGMFPVQRVAIRGGRRNDVQGRTLKPLGALVYIFDKALLVCFWGISKGIIMTLAVD